MTRIIDYRRAGAADGQLPVSVERAGNAVIITIDFGEAGMQAKRNQLNLLIGFLFAWVLVAGVIGSDLSGKEWLGFSPVFGGGAALLLWRILTKGRELRADPWWRLTASPAGLLIERQNRNGAAYSRTLYARDRIRSVTVERISHDTDARDAHEVCIYAPHPHCEPARYLKVRRHEGEIIVNGIREGLQL